MSKEDQAFLSTFFSHADPLDSISLYFSTANVNLEV